MTRNLTYYPSNTALNLPLTVKGYLKSKGYSTQNLKILKQLPDGILLNGVPARVNARLSLGDTLTVHIKEEASSENIVPVKLPLNIIYEDEDLLVVNKPAGMPIHPSQNNFDNTLANALAYYFQQKNEPFVFRCIGRLDRDTSGLTVIAKHFVSAGILGDLVAEKTLRTRGDVSKPHQQPSFLREYLAIVRGTITPASGTITAPLGRKPGSIIERCIDFENGEPAITHYQVLEEKNGYCLVSLILGTGRTHQIRIHMKYIGRPLVGDYLYNPADQQPEALEMPSQTGDARTESCISSREPATTTFPALTRQALHSHRLSFPHPMTGRPLEFIAPLPDDMQKLLS